MKILPYQAFVQMSKGGYIPDLVLNFIIPGIFFSVQFTPNLITIFCHLNKLKGVLLFVKISMKPIMINTL